MAARKKTWHQVSYQGRAFEFQIGGSFIAVREIKIKRPPAGADIPTPIAPFVIPRQDPLDHKFLVQGELHKKLPPIPGDPFGVEFY